MTGKTKPVFEGMGLSGQVYQKVWQTLEQNLSLSCFHFWEDFMHMFSSKSHDRQEIAKFCQVVSGCLKFSVNKDLRFFIRVIFERCE